MEYRVREFLGVFSIQCKHVEKNGMLWFKKEKAVWYPVNVFGKPSIPSRYYLAPLLQNHSNIEDAFKEIEELKKGVRYHSCMK